MGFQEGSRHMGFSWISRDFRSRLFYGGFRGAETTRVSGLFNAFQRSFRVFLKAEGFDGFEKH